MNYNKTKEIEFYIPTNLSIDSILKKENKRLDFRDNNIDKFHYIIDYLYFNSLKSEDIDSYIPINKVIISELFSSSNHWHQIKNILIKYNIIEQNKSYTTSQFSKGYRLTEKYRRKTHRRILSDSTDSTFITKLWSRKKNIDKVTQDVDRHLQDITINDVAANKWVTNFSQKELRKFKEDNPSPYLIKKLNKLNSNRKKRGQEDLSFPEMLRDLRISYKFSITSIKYNNRQAIRDIKGKRIHTLITSLKTELKQFLYLKERPKSQMMQLDIANSQPFIFTKILVDYYKSDSGAFPEDVIHYIDLVSSGTLYAFLCDKLNITDPTLISKFKQKLFANIFYGKSVYKSKEKDIFNEYFPNVLKIIDAEKLNSTSDLPIKMQRVESKIIIDSVLTHLFKKYGTTTFFTPIHDNIICEEKYVNEVRFLMEDAFEKEIGLIPTIRESKLN